MKYNIVITAGGTSERIDNVRKITNGGTGKLGSIIAEKLMERAGDKVEKIFYICSENAVIPFPERLEGDAPDLIENADRAGDSVDIIEITGTDDLKEKVETVLTENDIHFFIHSMAVSDYSVDYVTTAEALANSVREGQSFYDHIRSFSGGITDDKISSYEDDLIIKLKRTPKIISIIKDISPETFLVGFKLLDGVSEEVLIDTALKLKEKNRCDLVVANDLSHIREGEHRAFIVRSEGQMTAAAGKKDIAEKLIDEMLQIKA